MTGRGFLADRRWRWAAIAAIAVAVLVAVLLLVVAAFPWGRFKPRLERELGARIGRPVTIGTMQRRDTLSFTPTVVIRNLTIPQPRWAGRGDFVDLASATIRFNAFAALLGHVEPKAIALNGLRVALVRDANGRENWRLRGAGGGASKIALDRLVLNDARLSYRDARIDRHFTLVLAADATHGVTARGTGAIQGHPVTIVAHGPAITDAVARWPFTAALTGKAVGMTIKGTMAHPLDAAHMSTEMTAHATDLKLLDDIIEAGLFGTQPVKLAAHVDHDGATWRITRLRGIVGRSGFTAHITSRKAGSRIKIDGAIAFDRLDFDDLASDAGLARAQALTREAGRKLVPNTRINLAHVGPTDGRIAFDIRRLVDPRRGSSLAWARGVLTLDHRRLTLAPLTVGLTKGTATGRIVIDQRDGGAVPKVTLALALRNSSIATLVGGGGEVSGTVAARLWLTGSGSTFREAVGDADGHIGLVARDGALPAKLASELGFDAARTLTTGDTKRAGLRCIALGLDMAHGAGTIDPLVIDTTRAQSRGTGTISFPAETMAIRLTGAPKAKSVLRLPGALIVSGTIQDPHVRLQKGTKSLGNILKAIGQSIVGDQPPRATDADCAALAAKVLGS